MSITPAQFAMMEAVGHAEDVADMEMAERLCGPVERYRTVLSLERRGWLSRESGQWRLSAAGRTVLRRIQSHASRAATLRGNARKKRNEVAML